MLIKTLVVDVPASHEERVQRHVLEALELGERVVRLIGPVVEAISIVVKIVHRPCTPNPCAGKKTLA